MRTSIFSFLILALSAAGVMSMDETPGRIDRRAQLSNSQRLARGLAPKAPVRLYDPSRARALVPRASGSPGPQTVYLAVTSNSTTKYAYVMSNGALGVGPAANASAFIVPDTGSPDLQSVQYQTTVEGQTVDEYVNMANDTEYSADGYYRLVGSDTNDNGSPQSAAPYESSIFNYTTVPGAVSLNYTNTAGNETALYAFVDDGGYLTVRTNGTADSNHTAVTSMQWITTLPPCRRSRLDPRAC
ncbi:hypothetical protein EHS25_003304 [Saitozyma podzolica]|uniref:Uncharacterized protein n=1 Tax=Saitozyma podzolica TaxID=1890683 RepID=A0A427Y8Q6_9TREE|nr:hypothetical protein EHS25_003304 [Saitozyma podzolica]